MFWASRPRPGRGLNMPGVYVWLVVFNRWWKYCSLPYLTVCLLMLTDVCYCLSACLGVYPLTLSPPIPLRLYTLPYWSNRPFLISDIRALWRSVLSARAPECQTLKMVGLTSKALNPSNSSDLEHLALNGLNWATGSLGTGIRLLARQDQGDSWPDYRTATRLKPATSVDGKQAV